MSPLRPMWRSSRRSRRPPRPTCATPSDGSTTSSPTRTRRTGEDGDAIRVWVHRCDISKVSPASCCVSLPGVKKPLGQYGPAGVADTTSGSAPASKDDDDDDDDDDIDLFGSDDEVRSLMSSVYLFLLFLID